MGVMVTYPSIDGMPAHNSSFLMTDILRGELGFKGLVLSEGEGVQTLIYDGIAGTEKEAGAMAARAGMDVSINYNQGYFREMVENVREGRVSMQIIDRSVKRVLQTKYQLGLFDNPFIDPEQAKAVSHTAQNQELALQAAKEGIVLLKNEKNLLPLDKNMNSIAVIGPNADNDMNQLGDYTSDVVLQDVVTVLEGIKKILPEGARVNYVKGCSVKGEKDLAVEKAVKAARISDVALVVVGENEWQAEENTGTNGEGYDAATLELTGHQQELIERVFATGTPTVVVLINGRPLAIPWIKEHIPAILEAWIPGEKGGDAIAAVLFGDYNPDGRLPVTFPRHAGQLPVYYNHKPSKEFWIKKGWGKTYVDLEASPLFEFGFGLSYTKFEYSDLIINPDSAFTGGNISVCASIKNTGDRSGAEVVQVYLRDRISSVVTPVKQLKAFEKVYLKPGEERKVCFTLTPRDFMLLDANMQWKVEPGDFDVMVGSSSEDIRLRGNFTILEP
jgi:beta-glucosidase